MFTKKLLFLTLLISINLSCLNQSLAGWFVEPYLGYEAGVAKSGEQSITEISIDNNSINGMFFGARTGYSLLGFAGGVEYSISKSQWKEESTSPKDSFIFASFGIPGIRILGAIGLSHKFKVKTTQFSGKSYKIGLAFTGTPLININVEYLWRNFNKNNSVGINSSDNFHKLLRLSISLPLP